jgi:uncharacterized membrane protein
MTLIAWHPVLATWGYEAPHQFVSDSKIHPILVNFTAARIPVSLVSDLLGRNLARQMRRATDWWTLCFAAIIPPFTAIA